MDPEVVVGIIGAVIAIAGVAITFLQLRRTPKGAAIEGATGARGRLVVGDIPREPLSFRHRADLTAAVGQALAARGTAVLLGARGVGKTHLAAAHARGRPGVVLWVVADDVANVVSALVELARARGLADEVVDASTTAKEALRHLERTRDDVLLVLDNAADVDALSPWLPRHGRVRVVITTTNHDFTILGGVVRVGVFEPAEAVAFLCARADRAPDHDAEALAAELGGHPLALAQAGWVIRKRKLPFADHLARIRASSLDAVLAQVPGDDYPLSVREAVLMAISEVDDPTGAADRVLDFLCVASASGVRRDLLRSLSGAGDVDDALGTLAWASLIGFDVRGETVTMHRLNRRVVFDRARRDGRLGEIARAAVATLVEATRPADAGLDLVDHVAGAWAALRDAAVDLSDGLPLRRWSVRRTLASGDLARSVALAEEVAADHRDALPHDHPDLAESLGLLRQAYVSASRYDEAIGLAEQRHRDHVDRHGADHPLTIRATNTLGYLCEAGGRLDRAERLHRANLTAAARVCGPDDQLVLMARINLASACRSMGRVDEAVALFEENLRENVRVHGEHHPSTVNARGELARAYVRVGRAEEGVSLHEANRPHEDQDGTYWWPQYRAAAYSAAGRHGDAIALLRALCARADDELAQDNPNAIRLRLFLARALLAAGRTPDAVEVFDRAAADRGRVLGPDHFETLNARRNLALALAHEGRARAARKALTAVAADYDRVLGPDHPYSRGAHENLAALAARRGPRVDSPQRTPARG